MAERKTASDYRRLPYTRVVEREVEDGDRYYVARIEEIPWIEIDGDSREEALLKLDEVFDDCIESLIESGEEVPEPTRWPTDVGADAEQLTLSGMPEEAAESNIDPSQFEVWRLSVPTHPGEVWGPDQNTTETAGSARKQ